MLQRPNVRMVNAGFEPGLPHLHMRQEWTDALCY